MAAPTSEGNATIGTNAAQRRHGTDERDRTSPIITGARHAPARSPSHHRRPLRSVTVHVVGSLNESAIIAASHRSSRFHASATAIATAAPATRCFHGESPLLRWIDPYRLSPRPVRNLRRDPPSDGHPTPHRPRQGASVPHPQAAAIRQAGGIVRRLRAAATNAPRSPPCDHRRRSAPRWSRKGRHQAASRPPPRRTAGRQGSSDDRRSTTPRGNNSPLPDPADPLPDRVVVNAEVPTDRGDGDALVPHSSRVGTNPLVHGHRHDSTETTHRKTEKREDGKSSWHRKAISKKRTRCQKEGTVRPREKSSTSQGRRYG